MKDRKLLIKELGIHGNTKDPLGALARQCAAEYKLAWDNQKPKKDKALIRLKLYNNQRRDEEAVGDTTMFSTMQTVLASLYTDRLMATWEGQEQGDEDVADNLNALSRDDYDKMGKDITDYFWDWDTCFFGRGLLGLEEYVRDPDKNIFLPIPHVLDPITFMHDPFAISVNGDMHTQEGGARNYGWETKMTEDKLENNQHIFDDLDFDEVSHGSGSFSILSDAVSARADAQGLTNVDKQTQEKNLGVNARYDITIWHTFFRAGSGDVKRVRVWLANDRSKVIGVQLIKTDYWPVIDRPLYPHSQDWDGTSIPDLTEDKQRARAIAQNLSLKAMKADLYPMYAYDSNKITNRKDLKFNFNKFIPVDGKDQAVSNAIAPIIKARPNMQLINFIYETLDASAQKATATPDIQQGIQSQKDRPLGETNLLASRVDTRYSLSAKVFGWSEKTFWRMWYQLHKDNFKEDIDEKVLRTVGAFGAKWRPLKKENLITENFDPDVRIESSEISRAKQLEERSALTGFLSLALQDPGANRRYGLKKLGRAYGMEKDEIERLLPPTIDERIAEDENDALNDDKVVPVRAEDDHNTHLEIHSKANDTKATMAHIETHKKALSIKKQNPDLFPADQQPAPFTPGQEGKLPMGNAQTSAQLPVTGQAL